MDTGHAVDECLDCHVDVESQCHMLMNDDDRVTACDDDSDESLMMTGR